MSEIKVKFKKLVPEAKSPVQATAGDSGWDVVALDDGVINEEFGYIEYRTGLAVELPEGYEIQIRPRSSISKYDLVICNSPGTVDNPYRGEIKVRFKGVGRIEIGRLGPQNVFPIMPVFYKTGDKIAQLIVAPVPQVQWEEVSELNETARGAGGFGSSGN